LNIFVNDGKRKKDSVVSFGKRDGSAAFLTLSVVKIGFATFRIEFIKAYNGEPLVNSKNQIVVCAILFGGVDAE
jgi:hypothetical protein